MWFSKWKWRKPRSTSSACSHCGHLVKISPWSSCSWHGRNALARQSNFQELPHWGRALISNPAMQNLPWLCLPLHLPFPFVFIALFLFNPSAVITALDQLLAFICLEVSSIPPFLILGAVSGPHPSHPFVQGCSQTFSLLCNRAEQTRAMTKKILKLHSLNPSRKENGWSSTER